MDSFEVNSSDSDDLGFLSLPGDDNIMLSKLVTSSLTETIFAVLEYLNLMLACLFDFGDKKHLSRFFVFFFGVFCFEGLWVSLFCLSSSSRHVWLTSCLVSNNIWPTCLKIIKYDNCYLCLICPTFLLTMTSSCMVVFSHILSRSFPYGSQPDKREN